MQVHLHAPVKDDKITRGSRGQLPCSLHGAQALIEVDSHPLRHQAAGLDARRGILTGLCCSEPDSRELLQHSSREVSAAVWHAIV